MFSQIYKKAVLFIVLAISAPSFLLAQTADEVKLNVLSALSTPLPITVVGPLLTRDVIVTEEGDGFRATLQDTALLGLFPFGDVSMKIVPLDTETYSVSDLQFPKTIDFPGLAAITLNSMTMDGTWSITDRSYTELKAELNGLGVLPGQGDQGRLSLGQLAFDVQKEPNETDTESRFNITLSDVSATGFASTDVSVGGVEILLSANGERPVDLYSLLREVIMVAGQRDGGIGLQRLGESLLGNTYGSVALDLRAQNLNVFVPAAPDSVFFKSDGLQARLGMQDVNPRDWGAVELLVNLDGVEQQNLLETGAFAVERAVVRLGGSELPVADMFAAARTLDLRNQTRPISVSKLLDGFAEFGALELSTEGEALSIEVRDSTFENERRITDTLFFAGYDSWGVEFAIEGLNKDEGVLTTIIEASGGAFEPGKLFNPDDMRHVDAWFPTTLAYDVRIGNLNEAFLKRLFKDVTINDINEPIEILVPLMLYASASVFEIAIEGNRFETGLFSVTQDGAYRVYPAKFLTIAPFEGQLNMRMTGFDALLAYFEELFREESRRDFGSADEISMVKSVAIVLRNLGTQSDDGSVVWEIDKPDADLPEISVNGTTLHFPEFSQFLPLIYFGSLF